MRTRIPALATAELAAGLVAVAQSAPAQAPARAGAQATIAAGDLGVVRRSAVDGGGRDEPAPSPAPGWRSSRAALPCARRSAGGGSSARASATAEGVTLFGGLVTAERVRRRATTGGGSVSYGGSVRGLVIDGVARGDRGSPASWTSGGARLTVNTDGAGLRGG